MCTKYQQLANNSISSIKEYLKGNVLSDSEIYRIQDELQKIINLGNKIICDRTVTAYACGICGMIFKIQPRKGMRADDSCYEHIQYVHGYPDEDAALSCKNVYVVTNEEIKVANEKAMLHPECIKYYALSLEQQKEYNTQVAVDFEEMEYEFNQER
jgi:hypothetical protein